MTLENQTYLVQKGDTLWGISRHFCTDVDTLANLNNLKGRVNYMLAIGQALKLPTTSASPDTDLTLCILDLVFRPIKCPELRLVFDGQTRDVTGSANGIAGPISIHDHARGLMVYFKGAGGQYDLIADHSTLPLGKKRLTVTSRQLLIRGRTLHERGVGVQRTQDLRRQIQQAHSNPHIGTRPPVSGSTRTNGSPSTPTVVRVHALDTQRQTQPPQPVITETRVEGGKPQQAVGIVFAEGNLLLSPPNEKYRKILIASAKTHRVTPQILAALINAEASKLKTGEWNARAKAESSSAAGLTQFLAQTWLQVATDKRSAVNQMLKAKYGFEQVGGHWDEKRYSIFGKTGNGKTPIDSASVLALRYEPEFSIDAAAVYGLVNLDSLRQLGLNVDSLAPEDMAKLMYIAHHEGAAGAAAVLLGKQTEERAAELLPGQVGSAKSKELASRFGGHFVKAYQYWLYCYTDSKINVIAFMVKPGTAQSRSVADIAKALNGKHPGVPAAKPASLTPHKPSATTSGIGGAGKFFNPLKICVIRTALLASAKSATFGLVRNGGTRAHQGVDLAAEVGTTIYATASGKVILVSMAYSATAGFGASVLLQVDVNDLPALQRQHYLSLYPKNTMVFFFYAHLSRIDVVLGKDGTTPVEAGTLLGATGDSGNARGMNTVVKGGHLHFEVRHRTENVGKGLGGRIDPLPFLVNYTISK